MSIINRIRGVTFLEWLTLALIIGIVAFVLTKSDRGDEGEADAEIAAPGIAADADEDILPPGTAPDY